MLDLLLPGLVIMFCGSRAEVVSRQFCFLALSSVFFSKGIKAGGFEFGCVGRCLPVGTSAISRKVTCQTENQTRTQLSSAFMTSTVLKTWRREINNS